MIEPNGYASGRNENGNTITHNNGTGMIDLKSLTPVQFHGEDLKRGSLDQLAE